LIGTQAELSLAIFFLLSMSVAGVAHVWWLRSRLSARWRQPLDMGHRFRGRRIFGDNKMLRGFIVLPMVASISFPLLFSVMTSGFGFSLGELSNLFLKRQLDIGPGKAPASLVQRWIFRIIDRIDSIVGALIVASIMIPISALSWFWILLIGPGLHAIFSVILHRVGVKERAL